MPINLKWILKLPTGHLSRRIGMWVFISVILIETIIFIPSFNNRKKELLSQIRAVSTAKIAVMTQLARDMKPEKKLLDHLKLLEEQPTILGGAVYYSNGEKMGQFGEPPELTFQMVRAEGKKNFLNRHNMRYDTAWSAEELVSVGMLIIRHDAASVKKELLAYFLNIAGLVVIISLFVTVGALVALGPIVITPILKLRKDLISAGDAIQKDLKQPDFYSHSLHRSDELGEVISAFMRMYTQITEAIAKRKEAELSLQESFKKVEAFSRAQNKELEMGRQMQTSFLPAALPRKRGWEFAAFFKPARQVSGDFYDVFELPEGQVGLVIADVCDKGVGAALFMALFRSLIRIFSGQTIIGGLACMPSESMLNEPIKGDAPETDTHPEEYHINALAAVRLTNDYIVQNHEELGMFATLFFGVLCPDTGLLTYINGGHEPLLVVNRNGVKEKLTPTGPAVGLINDPSFAIHKIHIESGDMVLGFTDGVTEARSPEDELFGRDRVEGLMDGSFNSASELITHVKSKLLDFSGKGEREDDITLLAVQKR